MRSLDSAIMKVSAAIAGVSILAGSAFAQNAQQSRKYENAAVQDKKEKDAAIPYMSMGISLADGNKLAFISDGGIKHIRYNNTYYDQNNEGVIELPEDIFNNIPDRLLHSFDINAKPIAAAVAALPVAEGSLDRIINDFPGAEKYVPLVEKYTKKYELDFTLVMAVIWRESGFGNAMVSSVGAAGEMQIIPVTAQEHGLGVVYFGDYRYNEYGRDLRIRDPRTDEGKRATKEERQKARESINRYGALLSGLYERFKKEGRDITRLDERFDPEKNIEAGCRLLSGLIKKYDEIPVALAAYNAGEKDIRKKMVEIRGISNYVKSVLGFHNKYHNHQISLAN